MKVTTMVTHAVAVKLISNFVKGNPHFKPWLGAHGRSSWFLASGTPYVGTDPSKNVELFAEIDDAYVKPDDDLVGHTLERVNHEKPNIDRQSRDLFVWNEIGEICAARTKATLLFVPKGELSRQGSGYFLVLPYSMAQHLKIDFATSAKNIRNYQQILKNATEKEALKNDALAPTLTVWIGPYASEQGCATVLERIRRSFGTTTNVQSRTMTNTVQIKSGWSGSTPKTGHFTVTTLHYVNYRNARKALRDVLIAINSEKNVLCLAGDDWGDRDTTINSFFGKLKAAKEEPQSDKVWGALA